MIRSALPGLRTPAIALALTVALGGCASTATSSIVTGGPPVLPPGGTRVLVDGGLWASAAVGISAAAANAFAAVGIVTLVAVGNDWKAFPPPGMRADRAIHLQDCSKPITNWSANLRCATPAELADMARAGED